MEFIYSLKKYNLKTILISIFVSFHLFFWDIKFIDIYGFREIIVFTYFFLIYDLFKDNFNLFKKNKKNLFIISLFVLIIFVHQYINSYYDQVQLSLHNILGILGVYLLLILIYFYYKLILRNIKLIIIFFLFILFFSYLLSDWKVSSQWEIEYLCSPRFQSINKYIFLENSHLGMIFGATSGYFLYYYKNINHLYFLLLFSIIFLFIFFEASTTLYFSFISSMIIIFLLDYRFAIKKVLIYILIFCSIFFITNPTLKCFFKIADTVIASKTLFDEKYYYEDKEDKIAKIAKDKKTKKFTLFGIKLFDQQPFLYDKSVKYPNLPVKTFDKRFNLSTSVFINSLNISYETLIQRPLGWGLNRYENAFDYYMFNSIVIPYFYHEVYTLNYNDGSSNFSKIFTEFGWFGLFLIPLLFKFLFTKKMSKINKIFFLCIIITQLVRGAGFFNGGFAFSLIFILFTVFNFFEKNYEK